MGCRGQKSTMGLSAGDSRVSAVSTWGGRALGWLVRLLVAFLLVLGLGAAAWAGAPGEAITVAEWRDFLATIEERYDARASHAIASFFAVGASAEVYLWTDCVHGQTVGELSAWLRTTAPPELTLLEALELNADQHGCVARGSGDVEDARVARRSGIRP